MTCKTCIHFFPGDIEATKKPAPLKETVGACRRSPPITARGFDGSTFPPVHQDQRCGEHMNSFGNSPC